MKIYIIIFSVAYLLLNACSFSKNSNSYTVAEFVDSYKKDKGLLIGKTVVIVGFYMSSGVISGQSPYNSLIFYLFANEKYSHSDGSIFIEAKEGQSVSDHPKKLKVIGKVSERSHGKYPYIIDAEIVE